VNAIKLGLPDAFLETVAEVTSFLCNVLLLCSGADCVGKDDIDKYAAMCLPGMDGSHLNDVKSHMLSASGVKSAPSAKRSK